MAAAGATAPLCLRIGQGKPTGGTPQFPGDPPEPPGQQPRRTRVEPGTDQRAGIGVGGNVDAERATAAPHLAEQCGPDIEHQGSPKITHTGRSCGCLLRRPRLHAAPRALQPVVLLPHVAFDFSTRCPTRRVDPHFARCDGQSQSAAAARALELERDHVVAQLQDAAIGARQQQGAASSFRFLSRLPLHASVPPRFCRCCRSRDQCAP